MSDLISRQAAIDALDCISGVEEVLRSLPSAEPTITLEHAIDYLHETGWLQNHDRILTGSKIVPSAQPDVPVINVGEMEPVGISKTENAGGWLERNKDRILRAGLEGREVEFRIGGRLFAIREKAQ